MPPTLHRDITRLRTDTFDVLVIGGGIYGLTVACDAAQRGLSVALIEAHDFGSGTSFNHLRTIHGGLRYLQTFDLARARESIRERRALARVAPWAVRPLPFVLPLHRSLTRGPLAMRRHSCSTASWHQTETKGCLSRSNFPPAGLSPATKPSPWLRR